MKRKYSREKLEQETNMCAPTLYEGSHVFLELKRLQRGLNTGLGEVRCAYLLGRESGDSGGNHIHAPPKEYQQHFQEWLRSQPSDVQRKFEGVDLFRDVVLELLENMSRIYTVDAQPVAITGKSSSR